MARYLSRAGSVLLFAAIAAAMPGCMHGPKKQDPVVRLAPDEPMRMSKVTEDGDYVLFVAGDTHPIVTISLKTGDDIGFHREGDRVIAVYGIQEKSLPNGEYVWTRK